MTQAARFLIIFTRPRDGYCQSPAIETRLPHRGIRVAKLVGKRVMSNSERNALTIQPTRALDRPNLGSQKVLPRIISDALVVAKRRHVSATRVQFAGSEFRKQDYHQLLNWADTARMRPEMFIDALRQAKNVFWDGTSFAIEDGAITQVAFPPNLLKSTLDLSNVPYLTRLNCDRNDLQTLALTDVPNLRELYCEGNKLSEIDLTNVGKLEILCCANNALKSINLLNAPALITLSCGWNKIKILALPKTLLKLSCMKTDIQTKSTDSPAHGFSCVRFERRSWPR